MWLLDAFSQVVVYYAPTAPPGLPFPPPPSSALRRAVNAIRAGRRITPALHMLRGGCDSDRKCHRQAWQGFSDVMRAGSGFLHRAFCAAG